VYIKAAQKVNIIQVPDGGGGRYDVRPDFGNIFQITANVNAEITMSSIVSTNYGQSGTIILVNGPGGTNWQQLPANMLTPSGADINFNTDPNAVAIISFLITNTGEVLCNYVGHFA